jgi:preprotein translocase subunit YajC
MLNEPLTIQLLLVFGTVFGVYLCLVRPQFRRAAVHDAFVLALKPGDRIVTGGGFVGSVVSADEFLLTIALADNLHVEVVRGSIESFVPSAT